MWDGLQERAQKPAGRITDNNTDARTRTREPAAGWTPRGREPDLKTSCGCSLAFDDAAQVNLEITAAAQDCVAQQLSRDRRRPSNNKN
jgi:hypothetical protein